MRLCMYAHGYTYIYSFVEVLHVSFCLKQHLILYLQLVCKPG